MYGALPCAFHDGQLEHAYAWRTMTTGQLTMAGGWHIAPLGKNAPGRVMRG